MAKKGTKQTAEHIEKRRVKLQNIKLSEKQKERLRKLNIGKKRTETTKKKMSEVHKIIWNEKPNIKLSEWQLRELRKREKIAGRTCSEQCEICGAMGRLCFDHDHQTGKFRGWICVRCNSALGFVKDNTETLQVMIEYIQKNRGIII